jgi:hypothetical protein
MQPIVSVLNNIQSLLLLGIGALALVMLTVGGIRYVLAQGDQEQLRHAKHTVRNALLGLAVALMAPVLVALVKTVVSS